MSEDHHATAVQGLAHRWITVDWQQVIDKIKTDWHSIFEHFSDLQTRNQAARHKILQLLNELLDHHRKGILDLDGFDGYITDQK